MNTSLPAGWYPADGDPPGTQRYWDGSQWIGGPKVVDSQPVGGPAGQAPPLGMPSSAQLASPPPGFGGIYSSYPEKSQAILGLVLSLLSVLLCGLLAPFGWYISGQEVSAIDAGRRDPKNRSMATAGKIIGIIITVLMLVGVAGFVVLIMLLARGAAAT